eukprot:CAMPEP_0196759352 /NCGR_PEP_ID=MMETSP1091-20130531/104656_1 /TAXON_ID=302021 /ORGANISM="Rhodomonas sp., Strain CCMP768" /LENGTH=66 /DNA_ID=CAMNT_0042108201 /DNA_START=1279 /DNA_END=1479 /DNA_ORIENTATION=-
MTRQKFRVGAESKCRQQSGSDLDGSTAGLSSCFVAAVSATNRFARPSPCKGVLRIRTMSLSASAAT